MSMADLAKRLKKLENCTWSAVVGVCGLWFVIGAAAATFYYQW